MSAVKTRSREQWTAVPDDGDARETTEWLEQGELLFFPRLRFDVRPAELPFFSPTVVGGGKNVSYDARADRLDGATLEGGDAETLRGLLARFAAVASGFVAELLPAYAGRLEQGRTSFRPVEIAGRATSWRKDDTRLHIDSFPATPVQGKRILRLFANVNPQGQPRVWRIGEPFEAVARRFSSTLRMPPVGSASVLKALRITKTRRSAYDALMLQLHDRMKADEDYQRQVSQTPVTFPSGTTWVAFTDQVSHAAMSGQYQLEQTLLLPVRAMLDERRSPLRVLEEVMGRSLA